MTESVLPRRVMPTAATCVRPGGHTRSVLRWNHHFGVPPEGRAHYAGDRSDARPAQGNRQSGPPLAYRCRRGFVHRPDDAEYRRLQRGRWAAQQPAGGEIPSYAGLSAEWRGEPAERLV